MTIFKYTFSKKIIISIILFQSLHYKSNAQITRDSIPYKNAFTIDLLSIYYDFFDYRKQIRLGSGFEKKINKESFITFHIDGGVLDDYTFIKYYDFFNQAQGFYSIETNAIIRGFHFMPSYNYFIITSKRKSNQGLFAGSQLELNYYNKKVKNFNTLTLDKTSYTYNQKKINIGIALGYKYAYKTHFFLKIQVCVLYNFYHFLSLDNVSEIKPLNAQWYDPKNKFSLVSNINIGYAFNK